MSNLSQVPRRAKGEGQRARRATRFALCSLPFALRSSLFDCVLGCTHGVFICGQNEPLSAPFRASPLSPLALRPLPFSLLPSPLALCPLLFALCPLLFALCPLLFYPRLSAFICGFHQEICILESASRHETISSGFTQSPPNFLSFRCGKLIELWKTLV